jgi:hemoglobin
MTTENSTSLFETLGGADAIGRLVDAFYDNMDSLEEARGIRAMHGSDLAPVRAILKTYLAEWTGGPKDYSARRGHPRLRMRHGRFPIGPAERDAWMSCMRKALEEVVPDPALRRALHDNFLGLADWMRNDPDCAHDQRR